MPDISIQVIGKVPKVVGEVRHMVTDNTDYVIHFTFDSEWDGYSPKTVLFINPDNETVMPVVMDELTCSVPMLTSCGNLLIGVKAGTLVTSRPCSIPVYGSVSRFGDDIVPPEEFDKWTQIMERLLSPIDKTEDMLQPVGKDSDGRLWTKIIANHNDLSNRNSPDQHPIESVTGLREELDGKQPEGEYLTEETDPTVPDWAKQFEKPTYTAEEVGALPEDTAIPDESTVAEWGFTKNVGDYVMPDGGIPKSDLSEAVQDSLELADTALQEHQSLEAYRTSAEQDAIDEEIQNGVESIEEKIPSAASSSNQLADKEFVNSSIGTNTAYYISNDGQPFESVEQLEAYAGTVTNNDYAFVTGVDSDGNVFYDRYKATVMDGAVTWALEYRLNNSSFTAAQWAAITSGINSGRVEDLDLNTAARHTHENKTVLDGITAVLIDAWNRAVTWITTNGANVLAHLSDTVKHITAVERTSWNGKYAKPTDGIPKSDLSEAVQDSLELADTALQEHQSLADYRTASDQDEIDILKYEKPTGGIPKSDLSESVQDSLDLADTALQEHQSLDDYATKEFVNSSVQTATANFRGNWNTWAEVPTDGSLYPVAYDGNRIPTTNDYMVVVDASGYTEGMLTGTWRFKYGGVWETDGKAGWNPEYQVNETPFTAAQLAALNSGIDSTKRAGYDAHVANNAIHVTAEQKQAWNNKQDEISDLSEIRSGAEAGSTAIQPEDLPDIPDPVTKTADMTQAVGMDSDGKLWTEPTGGGGGTGDHTELTNRDAPDQHPISAITDLEDALEYSVYVDPDAEPEGTEAVTQEQFSHAQLKPDHGQIVGGNYMSINETRYDNRYMHKQVSAVAGNLAKFDVNGQAVDSDIPSNMLLFGGDEEIIVKIISGVQKIKMEEVT